MPQDHVCEYLLLIEKCNALVFVHVVTWHSRRLPFRKLVVMRDKTNRLLMRRSRAEYDYSTKLWRQYDVARVVCFVRCSSVLYLSLNELVWRSMMLYDCASTQPVTLDQKHLACCNTVVNTYSLIICFSELTVKKRLTFAHCYPLY